MLITSLYSPIFLFISPSRTFYLPGTPLLNSLQQSLYPPSNLFSIIHSCDSLFPFSIFLQYDPPALFFSFKPYDSPPPSIFCVAQRPLFLLLALLTCHPLSPSLSQPPHVAETSFSALTCRPLIFSYPNVASTLIPLIIYNYFSLPSARHPVTFTFAYFSHLPRKFKVSFSYLQSACYILHITIYLVQFTRYSYYSRLSSSKTEKNIVGNISTKLYFFLQLCSAYYIFNIFCLIYYF